MKSLLCVLLLCSSYIAFAVKKQTKILRTTENVVLDGELTEAFWSRAESVKGFTQNRPVAGAPASRRSDIRMAYDDGAIYIGATLFDDRDSMSLTLSQRDDVGNADWFGVVIDPYNAGTIGFGFKVTSAGVQVDELHQVSGTDNNWNAVWESQVTVLDDRWVAEIRIPFSAIRFPQKQIQMWGINFTRNIRRKREESFWNYYDPEGINMISQLGQVSGIEGVKSPVRLSFTPYVSAYLETFDGETAQSINGGMDLKYGLNEAFTLDVTLIPDFGQVQFDNQVLNLDPFEVRFNENRQFFTEGTELFNKQDLFYSRRIGAQPIAYGLPHELKDSTEVVVQNPGKVQLLNASKLSGRTKKGLGVGVFNALTRQSEALLLDTVTNIERTVKTAPFSNYNVFVVDQNLRNNSSVTFTNTSVMRSGETYDANVSALGGEFFTRGQKYTVKSMLALSQQYQNGNADLGYKTVTSFGKSAGRFLWKGNYTEIGSNYDQNDLGFLTNNNIRNASVDVNYNIFKPYWRFYRSWSNLTFSYQRLVMPNAFSAFSVSGGYSVLFKNFLSAGVDLELYPIKNHNWFEPRMANRFYEEDKNYLYRTYISSDYSKPFALDANTYYRFYDEENRYAAGLYVSPRMRLSDRFLLILDAQADYEKNNEGVALTRDLESVTIDGDPIFSRRDRLTVINRIRANYIFTNRMGLTFSLRHYWSQVEYDQFFKLTQKGLFAPTSYTGTADDDLTSLHNSSYNAFTIDMAYRWVFRPGSELSLVWKNALFGTSGEIASDYFENIQQFTDNPAQNSLSLKMLYYIDYWETKQSFLKGRG